MFDDMAIDSSQACDNFAGVQGGQDDVFWRAMSGPDSSLAAVLASLQDDQSHPVPGLDTWLDLGLFDF
jgi:hypothetical protein